MPLQVQIITFNHQPGSPGTNALSMRIDYWTPVQLPEYVAGRAYQYPAAYACASINAGGPVTILATFTGGPWGQAPGRNQLPWAPALGYASQWPQGQTTIPAATAAITTGVNTAGPRYTSGTMFLDPSGDYNLSRYLFWLTNERAFVMNCTDCANAVTSLANLVGANYVAGRIVNVPIPTMWGDINMTTAQILGIGGDSAAPAAWQV